MKLYSQELVQVAAVCVAMLENFTYGVADSSLGDNTISIVERIIQERHKQDAKWAPQRHTSLEWFAILMEEVGEVAEAINNAAGRL